MLMLVLVLVSVLVVVSVVVVGAYVACELVLASEDTAVSWAPSHSVRVQLLRGQKRARRGKRYESKEVREQKAQRRKTRERTAQRLAPITREKREEGREMRCQG
jgi:hypothetical protein